MSGSLLTMYSHALADWMLRIILSIIFNINSFIFPVMSELLFEGYGVPAVCYGIDSLFSMYKNQIGENALIVNCGYHTIHLIPVLRGKVIYEHARRINLGKNCVLTKT